MTVTRQDLLDLFVNAGVDPDVVAALKPDLPLFKQGVDSVDYPAILLAIADRFQISISEKDACELKTLADFEKRLNA
ncbi:MAG: acyl carrier protein [Deltaproteobacteria bacterium]|nr:acyl carrier protein [Deltaproteobacteria bacterium]